MAAKRLASGFIFSVSSSNFLPDFYRKVPQSFDIGPPSWVDQARLHHDGKRAIALGDSLAPLPWPLRINLDIKGTSVLIHPWQREEIRVLERYYIERIIISVACRGDTRGPKYLVQPKDSYYRRRLKTRGYIIQHSMALKKSVTHTNPQVES